MPVCINFKICDNARECGGIEVCPTKAMFFDEKNNQIAIDSKKCINCGACANACPVGAIRFASTDKEFKAIQKEIEDDPRRISDLFVERYGAAPIQDEFLAEAKDFDKLMRGATIPVVAEVNCEETINCLLKSTPIKDILNAYAPKATCYKFIVTEEELHALGLNTSPCLLFYNKGKKVGQIDGYFVNADRAEYFDRIKTMIK